MEGLSAACPEGSLRKTDHISRQDLEAALALARPRPGIVELRPLPPGRRVAMLLVGDPAVHDRLRDDFLPPTQARVQGIRY